MRLLYVFGIGFGLARGVGELLTGNPSAGIGWLLVALFGALARWEVYKRERA